jgi:hypothetical protein
MHARAHACVYVLMCLPVHACAFAHVSISEQVDA